MREQTSRPSLLIVDDVEANLIALDALLRDMDCDIVRARSGNEALRQLLKREFSAILLDVQMPGMDGYEVAHHARQNRATREVPILFLTAAHNSVENVLRGYGTGAVDFLFKPIEPIILRSKVRVFLELDMGRRRLQSAYQELQKTQSQLVQSAKMASLGELVAGVAHEINNPLAFSVSHLETARRSLSRIETELPAEALSPVRQYWDRAQNRLGEMGMGLERIRELVVKLRSFSRLDEGERKRVNIKECVDSVLTILGHRLKEPLQVETHFSDPAMLDCYPGLLNQAVMNLVANAIDAIEGPGRIVIRAGEESGKYVISVSDTGKGIPGDLRDRVLEPFFTTKPVGQGTGLGLSITYSIVEKHGGSLELASPEQGGTCAVMRLPLTQQGRP